MYKIPVLLIAFFLSVPICFAETNNASMTINDVKFNNGVLTTTRDASVFVHSLGLLNSGNAQEVATFMEHKLDEVVCGSWGYLDEMNSAQQQMIMKQLQRIKVYRENHPRNAMLRVDPREFSEFFYPFDESLAQCADDVLSKLPGP